MRFEPPPIVSQFPQAGNEKFFSFPWAKWFQNVATALSTVTFAGTSIQKSLPAGDYVAGGSVVIGGLTGSLSWAQVRLSFTSPDGVARSILLPLSDEQGNIAQRTFFSGYCQVLCSGFSVKKDTTVTLSVEFSDNSGSATYAYLWIEEAP